METLDVDPRTLHVPHTRPQGADPGKLARQLHRYGMSIQGMPLLELVRGRNGALRINDGVTRATRVAMLLPGQTIRGVIIQTCPNLDVARWPTIGDLLP